MSGNTLICSRCAEKVVSPDARFCSNCGNELNGEDVPRPEHQEKLAPPTNQRSASLGPMRFGGMLFVLLAVALIGVYAAILIPALEGIRPGGQNVTSAVIWTSILFYVLFRRSGRKAWMGAIAGFGVSFFVLVAAHVVAKTKQNDPDYILAHYPEYLAIQKYDPVEFRRFKTELAAVAKEPNATQQAVLAKLAPMLMAVVQKALTQTTDEAVILFARSKLTSLEEIANRSADDCSGVISGKANPDLLSRIVGYSSEQSRKANSEAIIRVMESAAGRARQASTNEARFARLIAQVEVRLKSLGLSTLYVFSDAPGHTAKERCAAGIQIYREALNLKEPDRAFVLRMFLI